MVDDFLLHPGTNSKLLHPDGIVGLGMPAPRTEHYDAANQHGADDHTRFHGGRFLTLTGVSWGDSSKTVWEAFDDVKGSLALGNPILQRNILRFRLTGRDADETIVARVATPMDEQVIAPDHIKWSVTLFAEDPRIYTNVIRSYGYYPTAAPLPGGLTFPLTFPLVFSASGTAGTVEVSAGGNWSTPPFMGVQGPVVNPIVENVTTGESLRFVANLGSSDALVLVSNAKLVALNGALRPDLLDAATSSWWELRPGTNVVRLSGSGMSSATALSVYFFDARI